MTPEARLAAALSDRYRIERELGQGGMATVYLAHDIRHNRPVAVKVLKPELAAALGRDRFLQEIQLAARLQHPNILPLHDSGEADGFLYFVMPYVEGESLRQRLARTGQLPVSEAARLLSEVVDALSYAHAQGVVHRDIKPDNVMLSGRHALVTDFGVAKAIAASNRPEGPMDPLTTVGIVLGTPAYMAPEQASADPNIDQRVDIYAAGVVGYELLAGRQPFAGMTAQQLLVAHMTRQPDALGSVRADAPPGLAAVIMKCLSKDANDRWQTADELMEQLEPFTQSSGSTRVIPGAWSARTSILLAGGAAVAVSVFAWVALRHHVPPAFAPMERVQLTFTGDASVPALSHDGNRIAYTTRQCDSRGFCTQNIQVQDVQGSGASTVLRDALTINWIRWTPDNRHLVFQGSFGPERWGAFSLPSLGGDPLWLGCCEVSMGQGDTVLLSAPARNNERVAWVRWVSVGDGITHDSAAIRLLPSQLYGVEELRQGRGLVLRYLRANDAMWATTTRTGQFIDSLPFHGDLPGFAQLTPDREGLMVLMPRSGGPEEYDDLLYRIDAAGRFATRPDTVARQLAISGGPYLGENAGGDIQGGSLVYEYGPSRYSLWAMARATASSMRWQQRRLAVTTAHLYATLDDSGKRVLLLRATAASPQMLQMSVMPFDSGPEIPVGSPMELYSWQWSDGGRSIAVLKGRGTDTIVVERVDVATGRATPVATMERGDNQAVQLLVGGGMVVLRQASFQRIGVPGLPDSSFPIAASLPSYIAPSPDGRSFALLAWSATTDTLLVQRISIADGTATTLAGLISEDAVQPRWLSDGSIIVPVVKSSSSMEWYLVPAKGGPAVLLGIPPRSSARYRFSSDGRHVTAVVADYHTDIFMIRNFGDRLK